MPLVQAAGRAATDTRDQAGAPDTSARAAATPGSGPRKADPRTDSRRDSLPRVVGLLQRLLTAGGSYHDPLFERPDLVEDDYYRFRSQPRG